MANIALISGVCVGIVASGAGIAIVGLGDAAVIQKIILSNPGEIISKYKELSCVSDLFQRISWNANPDNNTTKTNITNSTAALQKDKTQGCISVLWQKLSYESEKWKGSWNLIWGLRDDKYGTIFVSTISAKNGKAKADRYIYVLEQKSSDQPWTTIGKWTKEGEDINSSGNSWKDESLIDPKEGWDFINKYDLQKICSVSECSKNPTNVINKGFDWDYKQGKQNDSTKTADQWWSKISTWFSSSGGIADFEIKKIYEKTEGYYKFRDG